MKKITVGRGNAASQRAARMPSACTITSQGETYVQPVSRLARATIAALDEAIPAPVGCALPVLHYVASNGLAQKMRGERVNANGSLFGVFASEDAAAGYIQRRGLGLCASIVTQ